MKIFNVVDFLVFIESNDELYFNESYGEIKQIVNENGDGVYSLMFSSRGEVEFKKVNLVQTDLKKYFERIIVLADVFTHQFI